MSAKKNAISTGTKASIGWQMRVQGHTWEVIAKQIGYFDGATAFRAVKNYFGSVPSVDHEMQRQIARERTEFLQRKALEQVDVSPTPANIRAAVETLRRAAALDGLDAALRVAVEPSQSDLREFVESMLIFAGREVPTEADIFAPEYVEVAENSERNSPMPSHAQNVNATVAGNSKGNSPLPTCSPSCPRNEDMRVSENSDGISPRPREGTGSRGVPGGNSPLPSHPQDGDATVDESEAVGDDWYERKSLATGDLEASKGTT